MGHGLDALHAGRGPSRDARCPGAGAGCPGWQGPSLLLYGMAGSGFPGWRPDVQGLGTRWMSGPSRLGRWLLAAGDTSRGRMSGPGPDVRVQEDISVFFPHRFHASLADGVVVPWRLHSSSSSVVFRQYLCMHTSGVSSSIPSSKGSSEHV